MKALIIAQAVLQWGTVILQASDTRDYDERYGNHRLPHDYNYYGDRWVDRHVLQWR